jgi:antitoxin component YwqK of YwqJK toxin-antitoxin module
MSLQIEYHQNNQIKSEVFKNNNKKEGEYKEYYDNGQLYIKCYYIDDLLNGEYIKYINNNKIIVICNYTNDILNGKYMQHHLSYSDDNDYYISIYRIINYKNGKVESEYKEYKYKF